MSPASYCDNCTGSTGGSECESSTSLGVIDSSNGIHRHPLHTSSSGGGVIFHGTSGLEQILSNHQASLVSQSTSVASSGAVAPSSTSTALDASSVAHLILSNTLDGITVSPIHTSGNQVSNETSVDVTCAPLTDCSSSCDQMNSSSHRHTSPSHLSNMIVTSSTSSGVNGKQVETSPVSIIRSSGAARKSSKVAFVEGTNGS